MHIVLFANTTWYLFNFRGRLIESLVRQGHRVTAMAPPDSFLSDVTRLGAEFYPLMLSQRGINPIRELKTIWRLRAALRFLRPDSVCTFTVKCNLYAGLFSNYSDFKHIANVSGLGEAFHRGFLVRQAAIFLYKYGTRSTRVVFAQNSNDAEKLIQSKLVPQNKVRRIPGSGVDLVRFAYSEAFPNESAGRIVLMFGRVLEAKGFDLLADIVELHPGAFPKLHFRIIGIPDRSRRSSRNLYARLQALHARRLLELLPPTNAIPEAISNCHCVLLPSTYNEGVPRSLLEALSVGRPILTTDWAGCRETVEDGKNGFLIPPGELQGLFSALQRFQSMDSVELRRMGQRSRKIAEERFDERIVLNAYFEALDLAAR